MTFTNEHAWAAYLQGLNLTEVNDLRRWCDETARYHGPLATSTREAKAAKRAAKWAAKSAATRAWLLANLKPGTRLKMRGTLDGHGLREFVKFVNPHHDEPHIVCRRPDAHPGDLTVHLCAFVAKVVVAEEWVSISRLLK